MVPFNGLSTRRTWPFSVWFTVAEPLKFAPVWLVILNSPELGSDLLSMGF
jgi:hypothetical protein